MSDIFDLSSIDDLPQRIKDGINIDAFATRILELFEIAQRELSIDEITVGYYRKFKEIDKEGKTKRQITVKLYSMSKEKNAKIKSVEGKKGVYALIKTRMEGYVPSDIEEEDLPF